MLRTNFPTKYLKTLLRLMHSYGILIIAENYELYHGNQLQSLTFFFYHLGILIQNIYGLLVIFV